MPSNETLSLSRILKQHKSFGYFATFLSLVVVCWIDVSTPSEFISPTLYLIPVFISFGFLKERMILLTAFLCAVLMVVEYISKSGPLDPFHLTFLNLWVFLSILAMISIVLYQYQKSRRIAKIRLNEQKIIVELGNKAVSTDNFEEFLHWMHYTLALHFQSKYSKVLQYFPDEQKVVLTSGQGWDEEIADQWSESTADAESFSGYTLRCTEPVVVEDLTREKRFRPPDLLCAHGINSCINALIPGTPHPYGILEVDTIEKSKFTHDDVYFVQAVARLVGSAAERCLLIQNLKSKASSLSLVSDQVHSFLAAATHDLKEPITIVKMMTEIAQQKNIENKNPHEMQSFLDSIYRNSEHMIHLVENLLQYARYQTVQNQWAKVNLDQVLQRACLELYPLIQKANALIRYCPLPHVYGDRAQFQRVFLNLISNSLKYRKKDAPLRVLIHLENDTPETAKISVTDNGIGIESQYLSEIFKPFKRISGGGEEKKGTGLGLSICKTIMQANHGNIEVKSEIGKYTSFILEFKRSEKAEKAEVKDLHFQTVSSSQRKIELKNRDLV